MARKPAAGAARRAPPPEKAALKRLSESLQRGATPDRMAREVHAVVDALREAGDGTLLREWVEEIRDSIAAGADDAAEQADDVDSSDAAAVKQSRNSLLALQATRDALTQALAAL